ncbi:MAG: hypothetical protein H6687_03345 [Bacillales bacterium]|nr:hypothetical protein [Bacillales bacterium]
MIKIIEATTKKLQKDFLEFPLSLYKNNEYYVPPLYADEKNIFTKKNDYYETCDQVYFNAYQDGIIVGRISGIIQKQYNEIHKEKRARFTRFDCIDDNEVAKALISAVEKWAKDKGMDTMCGPLGFSDLEREGLLIEGFDKLSTFEEAYNYPYYQKLIENSGYEKEVDWLEFRLSYSDKYYDKISKLSDFVLKRYNFHLAKREKGQSKAAFLNQYKDDFFNILDECYKSLYGVVPFTEKMKKSIMNQFKLVIDLKYFIIICNEKDEGVAFGLCFPGIGKALQKSGGKINPISLFRLIKEAKHPSSVDLGLIAVLPEYQNMAITAPILKMAMDALKYEGVKYLETNLNLEDNEKIISCWKYFENEQHKRRRSFIKKLQD